MQYHYHGEFLDLLTIEEKEKQQNIMMMLEYKGTPNGEVGAGVLGLMLDAALENDVFNISIRRIEFRFNGQAV